MARILLIDDEDGLRKMLRRALEEHGHSVTEAREGREALRLHRQDPAELVITDIQMPDRDGLEVLMDLRRESPDVKVIAMSGGGSALTPAVTLEMAIPLGPSPPWPSRFGSKRCSKRWSARSRPSRVDRCPL